MQDTDTPARPAFVSIQEFDVVTQWLAEARAERDALDHKLARIASLPDEWEEKADAWGKANRGARTAKYNVSTEESIAYSEGYEAGWDNAGELLRRELAK